MIIGGAKLPLCNIIERLLISLNNKDNIENLINQLTDEEKRMMILQTNVYVNIMNTARDKKGTRNRLIENIIKDLKYIEMDKLILLSQLTHEFSREYKITSSLNKVEIDRIRQEAHEEGFNKGKELRIKELKQMRDM